MNTSELNRGPECLADYADAVAWTLTHGLRDRLRARAGAEGPRGATAAARLRLTVGARERMEPAIVEATPLGLLGTEAVVRIGAAEINGNAEALRRLAEVASKAADLADDYDRLDGRQR